MKEKAAYLKGLIDGLGIDENTKEGKVIKAMSELLSEMAETVDSIDEDVTHERLVQCMTSAGGKLLEDVRLFDVYRDEKRLGAGKKSMAYALTYRAADRTLTSDEAEKAHERMVKKVCSATGAEVRG